MLENKKTEEKDTGLSANIEEGLAGVERGAVDDSQIFLERRLRVPLT